MSLNFPDNTIVLRSSLCGASNAPRMAKICTYLLVGCNDPWAHSGYFSVLGIKWICASAAICRILEFTRGYWAICFICVRKEVEPPVWCQDCVLDFVVQVDGVCCSPIRSMLRQNSITGVVGWIRVESESPLVLFLMLVNQRP